MSVLHHLVALLEKAEALDVVAKPVSTAVNKVVRSNGLVTNVLSGTPTGHPAHPPLTDVTIGAWASSTLLDLVGGRRCEPAADLLIGVGLLSAVPTATTGLNDWSDTTGPASRLGLVHATSNTTALTLFATSLAARRQGRRGAGKMLGLAGLGALTVGAFLGGHLSYTRGTNVNRTAFDRPPTDWTPVLTDAALTPGQSKKVMAAGVPVLLVRDGGSIRAVASTCSHLGGPLEEGEVSDGCVTCPWHGSRFRLDDGAVVRGPATAQQPVFSTRVRDGQIEVRLRR
jgi:nitrite reductase/ring-hydroxylating ferredoxin subunit